MCPLTDLDDDWAPLPPFGSSARSTDRQNNASVLTLIGLDIGQKRYPTAIAVTDLQYRAPETSGSQRSTKQSHFLVRHLQRLQAGTPYPKVATRLAEICSKIEDRTGRDPHVFVNTTGIGNPVIESLEAQTGRGVRLWEVYFNYGDRYDKRRTERIIDLGKAYLVSRLQVLLQEGRLHLPDTPEAAALASELNSYEIQIDPKANERYGAFRVGAHDDLVTALGLAVHTEPSVSVYPGSTSYGV